VKLINLIFKLCRNITLAVFLCAIVAGIGIIAAKSAGFKPLGVLGSSMQPAYKAGSLIFVNTNVRPEEVKVGDVITYHADSKLQITHRVASVNIESRTFTTKGDANDEPDNSPITYSMYIGVAGVPIPLLGYLLMSLTARKMVATVLILTGFLAAFNLLPVILLSNDLEKKS
jgi:signal peptidase